MFSFRVVRMGVRNNVITRTGVLVNFNAKYGFVLAVERSVEEDNINTTNIIIYQVQEVGGLRCIFDCCSFLLIL